MAGDGGNDCGALKAAHVGVALSDADASTVAPFTSLEKSITSVIDVLLEGRCGLASALASYKYMLMYGQVETFLQMITAYFSVTFTEWSWVSTMGKLAVEFAVIVFSRIYCTGNDGRSLDGNPCCIAYDECYSFNPFKISPHCVHSWRPDSCKLRRDDHHQLFVCVLCSDLPEQSRFLRLPKVGFD